MVNNFLVIVVISELFIIVVNFNICRDLTISGFYSVKI